MVILAEIGKNFVTTQEPEPMEVLLARAKELILAAKESGCDVAKFQAHSYQDEIHPEASNISPHFNHDRYAWVKRNTYPAEFWFAVKEYCREVGIEFLATPMSRGAAEMLNEEVGVDSWKIGSGDILDFVMLDYIRDTGKPVILSSGMSSLEELRKSYDYLREKTPDVSILHCVSQYPCPLSALNLNTIPFLKEQFPKATIGFSSHCLDIRGSLSACKLGAGVIEQHLTLDRNSWGADHKVSLLPGEMSELVGEIKFGMPLSWGPSEEALGVPTKYLQRDEEKFRPVFRKGLYASREIRKGEILESDSFYALRPKMDGALSSEEYPGLLGKVAVKDFKKYEAISK